MIPIVEVKSASVSYLIRHGASPTLKETFVNTIRRKSHDVSVSALSDVDFAVMSGEVLGVIGKNGAGKSTLLKLLARVLPPSKGRVVVRGSVAPMIELSAGFNFDLTGRENVVLYGTLLGRDPKDMRVRASKIAEWAEIEASIDLPLRTYSSGMIARLAFAIATDQPSDLILVDEVLSVGDKNFQKKSKARMLELVNSHSAVVIVTHDTNTILELCDKAILLDKGRIVTSGAPDLVVKSYLSV